MADAAVDFLVQNLRQLSMTPRGISLIGVESLLRNLSNFRPFLREYGEKYRKDAKLQELLRLLRDVVYDAEDIVDAFVTQKVDKSKSTKRYFLRAFTESGEVRSIAQAVEAVNSSITDIYDRVEHFNNLNVRGGIPDLVLKRHQRKLTKNYFLSAVTESERGEVQSTDDEDDQTPLMRKDNVVGFLDDAKTLIGYLQEETDELDVITIVGSPGMGKTTLAKMVFNDPEVHFLFPIRIWIYVSSEFTRWDVFLSILKELKHNASETEYRDKSDQELANLVNAELERWKFLVVMDDVWLDEDWKELKIAFPNKSGCKVLITSRQEGVARFANHNRDPHFARFLSHEESVLGLLSEILGEDVFPQEYGILVSEILRKHNVPQEYGILVDKFARCCDGLPLAIEVTGGILARMYPPSAGRSKVENEWEKVLNTLGTICNDDAWRRLDQIISLSYNNLPHHLRPCFLYFGMFPQEHAISKWNLIRMWIAEGFIQEDESITVEETAEDYLMELIDMNLVRIDEMTTDGRVKTCSVLNMMHQFCKAEALSERENFLQDIKDSTYGRGIQNYRRLCAHSNISDFISSDPYGPRVRSLICCNNDDQMELTDESSVNSLFTAFKLIRVLDVKPFKFSELSNELFKLLHLRYMHVSLKLNYLPSAFSKLWNIQTLIIDTTSTTLKIKADIWKMIHLRHFKTNASATLLKPGKNSKGGEKLQTLGTISPESYTEEIFARAPYLKKLGIRGKLASFFNGKIGSFDSLGKLSNLEKLKLQNHGSVVYDLPLHYKFPPRLRSLTLCASFLEWRHMSVIGLLVNLNVLKLQDKAFIGNCWRVEDGSFRSLKFLHIGRTDLILWIASGHPFPRLRHLELHNCEDLREIPFELAAVPNFQILDLYFTKFAAPSAKKIRDAKRQMRQYDAEQIAFKLSIFPPDYI